MGVSGYVASETEIQNVRNKQTQIFTIFAISFHLSQDIDFFLLGLNVKYKLYLIFERMNAIVDNTNIGWRPLLCFLALTYFYESLWH